jgi:hypothetical protein
MLSSKITFMLDAQAELTPQEREFVPKYKMGSTMLYTNMADRGSGILGAVSRAIKGIEVNVDDLVNGKHFECKDILEMVSIEEQLKEASHNFKIILDTAAHFGGEEVIEI